MAVSNPDDVRMSLGEHLEELRRRIILGAIGPVIFSIAMLVIGKWLISFLLVPLQAALMDAGLPPTVYTPSPLTAFTIYLKISLVGGLVLGLPFFLWQMWKFVSVGLYPNERSLVTRLVPGSIVLTILGLLFMYYIMLPFMLWFLINFAISYPPVGDVNSPLISGGKSSLVEPNEQWIVSTPIIPETNTDPADPIEGQAWVKMPQRELRMFVNGEVLRLQLMPAVALAPWIQADVYLNLVLMLALAFAISFQLPLIMLMVGWIGMFDYKQMASVRKFALLGCFIVGALLTPADPGSMFALAIPLYALWELGLLLVKWFATEEPQEPDAGETTA